MTDKIDGMLRTLTPASSRAASSPSSSASRESSQSSAAAPRGDALSLTMSAEKLQQLEQSARQAETTDPARIEQLRLAIESGEYEIDAQQLAKNLLSFERSLGE